MDNLSVFAFPMPEQENLFITQKKKRRRRNKLKMPLQKKRNVSIQWLFNEKFILSFE